MFALLCLCVFVLRCVCSLFSLYFVGVDCARVVGFITCDSFAGCWLVARLFCFIIVLCI